MRCRSRRRPSARSQRFDKTDQELADALQKLDDLQKANDQLAQQRLDQMKLEMAAERQKDLAERAEELAAKDPVATRRPRTSGAAQARAAGGWPTRCSA